jgi:hypothetical protein
VNVAQSILRREERHPSKLADRFDIQLLRTLKTDFVGNVEGGEGEIGLHFTMRRRSEHARRRGSSIIKTIYVKGFHQKIIVDSKPSIKSLRTVLTALKSKIDEIRAVVRDCDLASQNIQNVVTDETRTNGDEEMMDSFSPQHSRRMESGMTVWEQPDEFFEEDSPWEDNEGPNWDEMATFSPEMNFPFHSTNFDSPLPH